MSYTTKEEYRKFYLHTRRQLSIEKMEQGSQQITDNLIKLLEEHQRDEVIDFKVIHLFLPVIEKGEINTWKFVEYLFKHNYTVVVPKISNASADKENPKLRHYRINSQTKFTRNKYGIWEPDDDRLPEFQIDKIQMVIVPLLAVDIRGNRVGYGQGYYDRFLSQLDSETVMFLGVNYFPPHHQIIPHQSHDIKLHVLMTPEKYVIFT